MVKDEELRLILNKAVSGTYSASEAMDTIERLCRHLIQVNHDMRSIREIMRVKSDGS